MARQNKDPEASEKKRKGPSALEWASGMIGALLTVLILVFIGSEAIRSRDGRPPLLRVSPAEVVAEQGVHVVELKVTNGSHQTAAAVEIMGELRHGSTVVETSSATIGYVPGNSEREAGLMFSRDPRRFQLQVRVTGYELP